MGVIEVLIFDCSLRFNVLFCSYYGAGVNPAHEMGLGRFFSRLN